MNSRPKLTPRRGSGLLWALLVFACLLLGADFIRFTGRAGNATAPNAPKGDAVVALTGGSGVRIASGVNLVEAGAGARLLVSGVHKDVTADALQAMAGGNAETYDCCVDIGYLAETTFGNATETASWAKAHGFSRLIVVTSDYHMPRSLIVLQRAMPEAELIAYPVRTHIDPAKAWTDPASFRGLFMEWTKWRVTQLSGGEAS